MRFFQTILGRFQGYLNIELKNKQLTNDKRANSPLQSELSNVETIARLFNTQQSHTFITPLYFKILNQNSQANTCPPKIPLSIVCTRWKKGDLFINCSVLFKVVCVRLSHHDNFHQTITSVNVGVLSNHDSDFLGHRGPQN